MSVLDIVSGLAKATGQGYAGYGEDQQLRVKETLAAQKAKLDAENAAVLNRVRMGGIDPALQGQIAGARATATAPIDVQKSVDIATRTAPIHTQQAVETAKGVSPITVDTHKQERLIDNANPAPVQPGFTFPTATNADGQPIVLKGNTKTGELTESGFGAKSSSAKPNESQEKSYLFYNLMKNAEPEITTALGSGRIRPAAVSTYLGAGSASEIPLVGKAIGALAKPVANANLNEDEQKLIRAGKDFTAGVLRKESGAAVTASELMETMERYFPGMFGDKPGLTDAKTKARQQYMRTMEQEATPAIQYYGRQSKPSTAPAATPGGDPEFDALMANLQPKKKTP